MVDLPLEFRLHTAPRPHGGIAMNASESGFLVRSVRDIAVGTRLRIAVLIPKVLKLTNFNLLAEVMWKDSHWEDHGEGYCYGVKIIKILKEDLAKLRKILSRSFQRQEIRH